MPYGTRLLASVIYSSAVVGSPIAELQEQRRAAVQKIVQSEVFHSSDAIRRLLVYLSEKALAGEAEQLKEYSLGIDVFGKPPEFDPRHDSGVRLHVGRLRQKLYEYYLTEGKDDTILIELPKGGYCLQFGTRAKEPSAPILPVPMEPVPVSPSKALPTRWVALALLATLAWAIWATMEWRREAQLAEAGRVVRNNWTPELEALWAPLMESRQPTILAVSSPLFVGFQGGGTYRNITLNNWGDVLQDAKVKAIRRAIGNPELAPSRSYTGIGDAHAMFLLGKLIGARKDNLSFSKTADISWEQLSSNDLVLLGNPRAFTDLLHGMPGQLEIDVDPRGLRVLHPGKGEPEILEDSATAPSAEVYALITRTVGPNGKGVVTIFSSNRNSGTLAAVEAFTEQAMAANLVRVLREPTGALPTAYQIALHVRFKDSVPTQTTYVMHRVLPASTAAAGH